MFISLKNIDFANSSVIIACPSVGNVSQLAVDLIISSLKAIRVGCIWHRALLPFIGTDPFNSASRNVCTSCDVYFVTDKKLLLLQLRAPVSKENEYDFLSEISEWLIGIRISKLIILAGIFSVGHHEEDVKYGSFRYVCCPLSQKSNGPCFDKLEWIRMKKNNEGNQFLCPPLSGSGFARRLFNVCVKNTIDCTVLLYFCLEGDNVSDSVNFLKKINEWLKLFIEPESKLVIPPSWNYLFGNSIPDMMY